jgi:uncharacterized membrane protein YgdD (TMEM256/DUF423 family)
MSSLLLRIGSINAASSIIIQAIGSHKPWEDERKYILTKAFEMHMSSAIGMILCSNRIGNTALCAGSLMFIGSLLFSGIAYYRCFKNDKQYNYLMPYGGSLLILSWILLGLS